jgi:hypothetical protein
MPSIAVSDIEILAKANARANTAKAAAKVAKPAATRSTNTDGRERLLNAAVRAGVINNDSGTRAAYEQAYSRDREGTRAFLASIGLHAEAEPMPGDHQDTACGPEAYDESLLTYAERVRITRAREGKPTTIVSEL